MSPLVGLGGAGGFCLLHPVFRIDTEDQPHWHLVAIRQLQNYARDQLGTARRSECAGLAAGV